MAGAWDEIVGGEHGEEPLWELFHENAKAHRLSDAPDDGQVAEAMLELWEDLPYPGRDVVELPGLALPPVPLQEAILRRRTKVGFVGGAISLADLSSLLTAGYGAVDRPSAVGRRRFRTVPSAGALYPLELYAHARSVAGLAPGLYHYAATAGCLRHLAPPAVETLAGAFVQAEEVAAAAAVILITAVFRRATFKYGERGYRFALLEAGHVAQNVDLAASALGLPAANLGGFFDRELEALLDLDGVEHSVLYAVAVGSRDAPQE